MPKCRPQAYIPDPLPLGPRAPFHGPVGGSEGAQGGPRSQRCRCPGDRSSLPVLHSWAESPAAIEQLLKHPSPEVAASQAFCPQPQPPQSAGSLRQMRGAVSPAPPPQAIWIPAPGEGPHVPSPDAPQEPAGSQHQARGPVSPPRRPPQKQLQSRAGWGRDPVPMGPVPSGPCSSPAFCLPPRLRLEKPLPLSPPLPPVRVHAGPAGWLRRAGGSRLPEPRWAPEDAVARLPACPAPHCG